MAPAVPGGETLRAFALAMAAGVLVVNRAGTVVLSNPAAEQLIDRTEGELVGGNLGVPLVPERSSSRNQPPLRLKLLSEDYLRREIDAICERRDNRSKSMSLITLEIIKDFLLSSGSLPGAQLVALAHTLRTARACPCRTRSSWRKTVLLEEAVECADGFIR